jgi:hypothetical protein
MDRYTKRPARNPVRGEQVALPLRRGTAVAAHRRYHERLGAAGAQPPDQGARNRRNPINPAAAECDADAAALPLVSLDTGECLDQRARWVIERVPHESLPETHLPR